MSDQILANFAVVIVNYNAGELLSRCLEALACQTMPPGIVVIVDNASVDGSMEAVKSSSLNIKTYFLPKNIGFAAANNYAIKSLGGYEWLALLNPDAFPHLGWLEAMEAATKKYPEAGSFASRMICDDGVSLDGAGDTYHFTGLAWREGYGSLVSDKAYAEEMEVFSPCAGAALYRRDDILQLEGFDERFFCYMEDVDLGYRLQLVGKSCVYIPSAIVVHIGSAITGKISGFSTYHGHRNLTWTFIKNTPGLLLLLLLPAHIVMSVLLLPIMLMRGNAKTYAQAKVDAIKGLRPILEDRKKIQAEREVGCLQLLGKINYRIFSRK